ncbi:hypothetical protein V8B97DRAFT_546159 [Scleroderma yunnanense]
MEWTTSLRYSKAWLNPNLPDVLLPMYDMCRQGHVKQDDFQLLFSLPAMAYSSPHLDDVVHALVAVAVVPQLQHGNPLSGVHKNEGQDLDSPNELSDYIFMPGTRSCLQTAYETTMADLFSRPAPTLPSSRQAITASIRTYSGSGSEELCQLIDTVRQRDSLS